MDNPRPEKVAVVDEVKANFEASNAVVLTEYRGLDVDAMQDLRGALREAGGTYKIYKNTLVRFAANELDLEITDLLSGPTALAFVTRNADGEPGDTVTVAKALKTFAKDHPDLIIKGALLDDKILAPAEVAKLADIAPREELLARFAGGLAAPLQHSAGLLQAIPQNFAYALQALVDEGGAQPGNAAEATAEPSADANAEGEAEGSDEGADEAPGSTASSDTPPEEVPVPGEPASTDEIPETPENDQVDDA